MRIIGPPSASIFDVETRLSSDTAVHPRFVDEMLGSLWEVAVDYGVDPVGVVAQSYKETGKGNFTGNVRPGFRNTCGLKVRETALVKSILGTTWDDHPLVHAQFPTWFVGATAHVQHLCAYAGWLRPLSGGDEGPLIVDPRYSFVAGNHRLENFEDLSGKWAPSPTYGQELVAIARRLQGVTA